MIVPFVYSVNDLFNDKPEHLWIFYKYLYFCEKNHYPIIASDVYFNCNVDVFNDIFCKTFDFNLPSKEYIQKNQKYAFNHHISLTDSKNILDLECMSYEKVDKKLYNILNNIIDKLIADYQDNEITFLTWKDNATLRKIAEEREFKIIFQELSTIRKGHYNSSLCYFSFNPKYNDSQEQKYQEFKKLKLKLLNRKELLSLFLLPEDLSYLKEIEKTPKYKIGYATIPKEDSFSYLYSSENEENTIKNISKKFIGTNISYRCHPGYKETFDIKEWQLDSSKTSAKWILNNDIIVSYISNIGFEAMLYGKTSYVLSKNMPWSFITYNSSEFLEDEQLYVENSFINYMIFGYFVPIELAFDKEYILWRCNNPSIEDIYNKNLDFIIHQRKLNRNTLNLFSILTKYRELNEKEANKIINYNYYNEITKELNNLKNTIEERNNELQNKNNELLNRGNELLDKNKELLDKNNELQNKNKEIKILNDKLKAIILENDKLKNEQSKIEQQLVLLDEKYKETINEINNILNSKSWKLTKPLRAISNIAKKK